MKYASLPQSTILMSLHINKLLSISLLIFCSNFLSLQVKSIVMQYADQGDLYAKITQHIKNNTKFTEDQLWSIFVQITRGLKALHQLRILHRDLKSANVFMFADGKAKLGDMNVSKLSKSMCKTQTGTPYYASPQVWKDQPYDKKSDIWSLGCVFYQAIALKPPFRANDMQGLFKKVTRGFYPRIPPQYSDQLNNILKMLLQVTPHLRATCDKLLQLPLVLKHIQAIPSLLQQGQKKGNQISPKNQLLKTIKMNHDSKANIQLQMPRPRYMSAIQSSAQLLTPVLEQIFQGGFPKASQKLQRQRSVRKPKQQQNHVVKWNQKTDIVKKLTEYSQTQNISKSLNVIPPKNKNKKYKFQSLTIDNQPSNKQYKLSLKRSKSRKSYNQHSKLQQQKQQKKQRQKLPLIHQGRLKSISPQTLKLIIKRQKQKRRVYSIIDKKF